MKRTATEVAGLLVQGITHVTSFREARVRGKTTSAELGLTRTVGSANGSFIGARLGGGVTNLNLYGEHVHLGSGAGKQAVKGLYCST